MMIPTPDEFVDDEFDVEPLIQSRPSCPDESWDSIISIAPYETMEDLCRR